MLPEPDEGRTHYSPLEAVMTVITKADKSIRAILDLPRVKGKYVVRKITKSFLIDLMIQTKLIPVQSSTLYSMITTYNRDSGKIPKWWHNHTMPGPKHHLPSTTFDTLKSKFTETTDEGCSISKNELKKTLSDKLIENREKLLEKNTNMILYLSLPCVVMLMKSSLSMISICSIRYQIKQNQGLLWSLALGAQFLSC